MAACLRPVLVFLENCMFKHIHLLFVALIVVSFVLRVLAAEYRPAVLQKKWLAIAPHALQGLVLLTGIVLVVQGNWLAGDYGWLVAKVLALVAFIAMGLMAMRESGQKRWLAMGGGLLCLFYIAKVALTKNAWFFL
jgi:uncharacterized membrane protein SirB2